MKKITSIVGGILLLGNVANAKMLYECTGTGQTIDQVSLSDNVLRTKEDNDGDGKAEVMRTYIFDKGCLRKIREIKLPNEDSEVDSYVKDINAYKLYKTLTRFREDI